MVGERGFLFKKTIIFGHVNFNLWRRVYKKRLNDK